MPLSDALVLRLRSQAQRLTAATGRTSSPRTVLRDICGLQAQLMSAAGLGLRVRSTGLPAGAIIRALDQERTIVRTWLMRGTLHLVAADDLGWLLGLLGPVFAAGNETRQAQLGLARLKLPGVDAIRRILADTGPLTRYELVDRLRRRGIRLDPKTQAPIHLIRLAALQGVLCLGRDRDNGEPTYVLINDWVGQPSSPAHAPALGELARRYFAAYGPATVEDLASWSGVPMSQARAAVALAMPALAEMAIRGKPAFLLKTRLKRSRPPAPGNPDVRLLPAFDTYLLGYRTRELTIPIPPLQRRLQRGGGWLHPALVVNGRAVRAWRLARTGGQQEVVIEPFEKLTSAVRAGIEAESRDISRFLELPLETKIVEPT